MEKVTFDQRLKGNKGAIHESVWGRGRALRVGNSSCKDPEALEEACVTGVEC